MPNGARVPTPTMFWIVAVLSLIWSGFGAFDYLQTQTGNRDYLASMAQASDVSVDELIAHVRAMPWWGHAFWALGVWGSVAGSLLLLARSRFALHAFLVSLVGLIVTSSLGFVDPLPGQTDMTMPIVFTVILFAVLIALVLYTRKMIARRVIA